jgi:hypothetical protein
MLSRASFDVVRGRGNVDHFRGDSNCVQAVSAISSRPISMRRTSEVPAPIS